MPDRNGKFAFCRKCNLGFIFTPESKYSNQHYCMDCAGISHKKIMADIEKELFN